MIAAALTNSDPCAGCGGTGQDPDAPRFGCRDCRGDGIQLPHGQARCPRCDGAPNCTFCGGSGIVGDAGCWTSTHPEHQEGAAS